MKLNVKMFRNFFKRCTFLPVGIETIQVTFVRLKTTEVLMAHGISNSQKTTQELKNPLARDILKNCCSEKGVASISNSNQQSELSLDEMKRRLKVMELEVDIANQEGRRVPSLDFLKDHHWQHILTLPSKSSRMKYYGFLWQIEIKKSTKNFKKKEKAAASQERMEKVRQERSENPHIVYGLGHVSMFLRVYDSTINHWMNHRLIRAMQFSPKIVLDCSYDEYMTKREAENAAKQLMLCFAENRAHEDPFDLHYCNTKLNTPCMDSLQRYIPTMFNPEFPMNVHQKCFTDIFHKDKCVYLTPHCRTELVEYNPEDVYVVGAMVDTMNNEPLSLAKAKKLGLRMARLPLDRYLQWGAGSGKSLTLNQVVTILLDLKHTGDWITALRHVPRRKVVDLKKGAQLFKNKYSKHTNRINIHMDHLLKDDGPKKWNDNNLRFEKENVQFNLSTWGSNKNKIQ